MLSTTTRIAQVRRGFTMMEAAVLTICMVMVSSAFVIGAGDDESVARSKARVMKDAVQIRQIHQCFVIFANEGKDVYPLPGLINRLAADLGDGNLMELPGRGKEDVTHNTTDHLFSSLVMQNYMTPELCVSPVERNPLVKADDNFDYNKYNPVEDTYWDDTFVADLEKESNVSYAHLLLHGQRKHLHWRNDMKASTCILSSRGPRLGQSDVDSITCDPMGQWSGQMCFNDNHTELSRSPYHEHVKRQKTDADGQIELVPDNIFAMEDGMGGDDLFLTFTMANSEKKATWQHD